MIGSREGMASSHALRPSTRLGSGRDRVAMYMSVDVFGRVADSGVPYLGGGSRLKVPGNQESEASNRLLCRT